MTSAKTDLILSDLIAAQRDVERTSEEHQSAVDDRDALLLRARKTGTTAIELAELTGLTRQYVHRLLARAGLK